MMAFFEDLGKKITQTSQGVVQKTKDSAEVIKLNGMISDEEKRINNLYNQIGKQYFEFHSEAPETSLQNFVLEVKEAKAKINDYTEQVEKIKGVVRCPNCGGDVPYGAPFCSFCGTKMILTTEQAVVADNNVKRCVTCGMPISDGSAFCTHCGTKVKDKLVAESNSTQEEQPKLCPNCKSEIECDFAFCMNCGTKL